MALTAEDYESLQAAGLTGLFEDNRPLFTEMAQNAFEYARTFVIPTGQKVRVDDVNQALEPALRVSHPLKNYLAEKKLTQQYWYTRFGGLVLDELWEALNRDHEEQGEEQDAADS